MGMLWKYQSLQWRHNECDGVSNHRRLVCLLKCFFRCRSKKTSKLRVAGLCAGNSPVTGEFPIHRASKAENGSIRWCHHGNKNAQVCAKWQWNARDCVTWLHIRRSRECNSLTTANCVSLSFGTHPGVLAFITHILCINGIKMTVCWIW